ncbi:MAG: AraC family transcriptional regulator, partial [Roseibium sp.]|uniref:helix-turn-helix domain-containing protein n=1 Tax=Roseibium sp. TaxID=1936156 RepID=UPI00260FEF3A
MNIGNATVETACKPLSIEAAGHTLTLLPAGAYHACFTASVDSIGFAFDAQAGRHAIGSDKNEAYYRLPNSLALTPCGCDIRSASDSGGEYLLVSGPAIRAPKARYQTNIQIAGAVAIASCLRKWLLGDRHQDPLSYEMLIDRLGDTVSDLPPASKAARWMTMKRFRQVSDLIDENIAGDLTVAALAREIGVSSSFLSRAFTAYCGQTPYDFIL